MQHFVFIAAALGTACDRQTNKQTSQWRTAVANANKRPKYFGKGSHRCRTPTYAQFLLLCFTYLLRNNVPFRGSRGRNWLDRHLTKGSLGPQESAGSAVFAQLTRVCNVQSYAETTERATSIGTCRIYAMRPKIQRSANDDRNWTYVDNFGRSQLNTEALRNILRGTADRKLLTRRPQ